MKIHRILLVEDHTIVREGLKMILAAEEDMEVAAEAASGEEALELLRQATPDAVVLDVSLPGKSGLELLQYIKAHYAPLPVLMLSMFPEDQYAVRSVRAGAAGYMTKESAPEELVRALRKVVAGGRYISPTLAERLADEIGGGSEGEAHTTLSNREFEVLRQLGSGKTVSDIARQMNLSVKTVSTYRSRILEKMKLSNNAELTHYVVKNGLVD